MLADLLCQPGMPSSTWISRSFRLSRRVGGVGGSPEGSLNAGGSRFLPWRNLSRAWPSASNGAKRVLVWCLSCKSAGFGTKRALLWQSGTALSSLTQGGGHVNWGNASRLPAGAFISHPGCHASADFLPKPALLRKRCHASAIFCHRDVLATVHLPIGGRGEPAQLRMLGFCRSGNLEPPSLREAAAHVSAPFLQCVDGIPTCWSFRIVMVLCRDMLERFRLKGV